MALSGGRRIVRDLWDVGARHGRVPDPTPEVDPWEDQDPCEAPRELAVVFPGTPPFTVRLFLDGQDTISIEDSVDLEVPRHDTVAVVEALLSGAARLRVGRAGPLARLCALVMLNPMMTDLVVRLPEDGRTYTAPVPYTFGQGPWGWGIPWEREPG